MVNSNIIFTSSVYPTTGNINSDKTFISTIFDYNKLKGLKSKYFNYTTSSMLSSLQNRIIQEGGLCIHAKQDPCWGLIKKDGKMNWVCKCVNIDCTRFMECRPDFIDDEYYLFSPDLNDSRNLYKYYNILGQDEIYYPVVYGENVVYDVSKQESKVKNSLSESNCTETVSEKLDILTVSEPITQAVEITIEVDETEPEGMELSPVIESPEIPTTIPKNIFSQFQPIQQEEIIKSGVSQNIFVDAGPGTGKTYTLIKKINYLVCELETDPESIQVLSFTNAAVTEINNRLHDFVKVGGDRGLRNVDIRTFHSFAWLVIEYGNENYSDKDWKAVDLSGDIDYEESILQAANLINKFPDIIGSWKHFIVDEIQDLTGNKAKLVLSIIKACIINNCGFSIFGDSCQAIYDYVKNDDMNAITSDEFYNLLYKEVVGRGRFARLEENHRQTETLINLTLSLRTAILNRSQSEIMNATVDLHCKIEKLSKRALLLEQDDLDKLSNGKTLCFLCRNNGQTLRVSTMFRKRHINHILNAYETVENFAPWISQIFFEYKKATISFDDFSALIKRKGILFDDFNTESVWKKIQNVLRTKADTVDVYEFLEAVRTTKVNDSIFRSIPTNNIIVSNIHRAKGREYERVVLDESFIRDIETSQKEIGEYRTLYVALTRPKKELNICELSFDKMKNKSTVNGGMKRWYSQKYDKKQHVEVGLDNDVSKITFVKDDIIERQKYIAAEFRQGDEIKLKRKLTESSVDYLILHCKDDKETIIGKMSKYFIKDIANLVKPKSKVDYPAYIEDLFVESVYSYIAGKAFGTAFPEIKDTSEYCVWNWVNFRGLGHLIYDTY